MRSSGAVGILCGVPVGLACGEAFVVVLKDVVGEEELRVTAAAGTQDISRRKFSCRNRWQVGAAPIQVPRIGAGIFQAFHLFVELPGLGGGLADRANVRPGRVAWNIPRWPHRDSLPPIASIIHGLAEQ